MASPSDSPWAASVASPAQEPTVASALEKERTIKDIVALRDGLRGLLVRITEVDADNDKLKRENEMLATYVENLYVSSRDMRTWPSNPALEASKQH